MAFFATYERIWHFLPLTNVSGIFSTYERIWHFCHLRTYLAFFATYERIWHFLPLTNVSGIFCHLRTYLTFFATLITSISVTRDREKIRKLWQPIIPSPWFSQCCLFLLVFQSLYLTVTYLEAQMIFPVMSLLNDTSIWTFNIVKFYSYYEQWNCSKPATVKTNTCSQSAD